MFDLLDGLEPFYEKVELRQVKGRWCVIASVGQARALLYVDPNNSSTADQVFMAREVLDNLLVDVLRNPEKYKPETR